MSDVHRIEEPISTQDEKLIVQVSVGSLYPILPHHTGRYNVAERATRSHAVVGAGMFMATRSPVSVKFDARSQNPDLTQPLDMEPYSPMYLPEKWSAHTHPEGKVYFVREGPLKAVTDCSMYKAEVSEKVLSWISIIEKELVDKSMFTFPNTELYVQLEDEDCNYYFADHNSRTLFWLDEYPTNDLGLLPVSSPSHLKIQLEEHYWTHVEYFSMHALPFGGSLIEEAISQLIHGCGDQMTSSSSTFPYSFQESKNFLDVLTPARSAPLNGHVISTVARIFNVIAHNRYWMHYGQEQARLSRDTSILEDNSAVITWPATLSSALTFRSSDWFDGRLNTIFTDNFVYAQDWQSFMKKSHDKWRMAFMQSLAVLGLHIFCFFVPVAQGLAVASSGLLGLSILFSAVLAHLHQDMEEGTAGEAFVYLSRNKSEKFRFQALSLLFALPQAFSLWGVLLTFAQALTFVEPVHLYASCLISSVLGALIFASKTMFSSRPPKPMSPELQSCDVETVNKSIV